MVNEQHIAQLWARMARIYGHRWTSGFGESDDGTWLAGLRALDPENLADGLRLCIHSGLEWPPSLPEFRRLALGITAAQIRQAAEDLISAFDLARMTHRERAKAIAERMDEAGQALYAQRLAAQDPRLECLRKQS